MLAIHKETHNRVVRTENYNYNFDYTTGNFVRWGKTLKDDPDFSPVGPEILDIEISTICHKACSFCYKSNTAKGEYMSFGTFKTIFDKLPKTVTQIAFGTGTLSSNPDTWEIMNYCRQNFVVPNITVNGYKMDQNEYDKLSSYCGAVAVSHYNDDDCFNTVKELTSRGMEQINIHKLVSEETFDSCMELVQKCKTEERLQKLNCVVFLLLKPKGKRNELHPVKDIPKYRRLINLALETGVRVGFDSCSAPSFLKAVKDNKDFELFKTQADPCESTCFSYYINVRGIGFPCSFTEDQPEYDGTNVVQANDFMKDVWNGNETLRFRNRLLGNKDCNGCRNCPEFDLKMEEL